MENKNKVTIADIVGQIGNLYYCNDMNCFQLGSVKFEVVEDENDGYRSSMDYVKILSTNCVCENFLAEIKIIDISDDSKTIYALQDTKDNSFNWLEFGTENTDDYYPYFVFRTNVKKEITVEEEKINMEELKNKLRT